MVTAAKSFGEGAIGGQGVAPIGKENLIAGPRCIGWHAGRAGSLAQVAGLEI